MKYLLIFLFALFAGVYFTTSEGWVAIVTLIAMAILALVVPTYYFFIRW